MLEVNAMSNLLTPEEVARRLSVNHRTIGNWLREGRLRGVKAGRLWRIPEWELNRFLGLGLEAGEKASNHVSQD